MRPSRRSGWPCRACCTSAHGALGHRRHPGLLRRSSSSCSRASRFSSRPRSAVAGRRSGQPRTRSSLAALRLVRAWATTRAACSAITICTCSRWRWPARSCARTTRSRRCSQRPIATRCSNGCCSGRSRTTIPRYPQRSAGACRRGAAMEPVAQTLDAGGRGAAARCGATPAGCWRRCTAISPIAGEPTSHGLERLRFAINVLTRLRFCTRRRPHRSET